MRDSTENLQSRIKNVLADAPMTAQEIADKTGATVAMVRLAMGALESHGHAISMGTRPIRYCATKPKAKVHARGDYYGEPRPYLRPGSYSPPARPRVTLPFVDSE
jgi:hypothetical protein